MAEKAPKPDVGKEVTAYCGKCKDVTIHVITSLDDGKIKKVMCKACNSTHNYKAEKPKKAAAKEKKVASDAAPRTTIRRPRKKDWAVMRAKIDDGVIVDYNMHKDFTYSEAIKHKKFGVGVITKILSEKKIEVVFEENTKVLAQNWD